MKMMYKSWSKKNAINLLSAFLQTLIELLIKDEHKSYFKEQFLNIKGELKLIVKNNKLQSYDHMLETHTKFYKSSLSYVLDEEVTLESYKEVLNKFRAITIKSKRRRGQLYFLEHKVFAFLHYCRQQFQRGNDVADELPFFPSEDAIEMVLKDDIFAKIKDKEKYFDAIDFFATLNTCEGEGKLTKNAKDRLLNSDYKFTDETKFEEFEKTYNGLIEKTLKTSKLVKNKIMEKLQSIIKTNDTKKWIEALNGAMNMNDPNTVLWTQDETKKAEELIANITQRINGHTAADMSDDEDLLYKDPIKDLLMNLRI